MIIESKKQLKFVELSDMMMNRRTFHYTLRQRLMNILCPDYVMQYLRAMRRCSYYRQKVRIARVKNNYISGGGNFIAFAYYYSRFLRLGIKIGFSLGYDTFGYALWVPHHGTIVVGENNTFGNYTCLHTSTCVTATGKIIGDGCLVATGVRMTTNLNLADYIQIGANSVVNKSFEESNIMIAGAPAVKKKDAEPWYYIDAMKWRYEAIEKLKKQMNL